jgi:hypothetical protein
MQEIALKICYATTGNLLSITKKGIKINIKLQTNFPVNIIF